MKRAEESITNTVWKLSKFHIQKYVWYGNMNSDNAIKDWIDIVVGGAIVETTTITKEYDYGRLG